MMEEWCKRIVAAFTSNRKDVSNSNSNSNHKAASGRMVLCEFVAVAKAASDDSFNATKSETVNSDNKHATVSERRIKKYRVLPGYLWSNNNNTTMIVPPEPTEAPAPDTATVTLRMVALQPSHLSTVTAICQSWVERRQWNETGDDSAAAPEGSSRSQRYEKTVSYQPDTSVRIQLWEDVMSEARDFSDSTMPVDSIAATPSSAPSESKSDASSDGIVICLPVDQDVSDGSFWDDVYNQVSQFKASIRKERELPLTRLILLLVDGTSNVHYSSTGDWKAATGTNHVESLLDRLCRDKVIVGGYTVSLPSATADNDDTSRMDECFQSIIESILSSRISSSSTAQSTNAEDDSFEPEIGCTVSPCPVVDGGGGGSSSDDPIHVEDDTTATIVPLRSSERVQKRKVQEDIVATVKKPKASNDVPAKVTPMAH